MESKDVVRRAYQLFSEGKAAEAAEMFAPDAVWTMPGRHALSGEFTGRDAILNDFLAKHLVLTDSTFRASAEDVADGAGHTFVLQHGTAQRNGKSFDYTICHVFTIRDGLIHAVRSYPDDGAAHDAFWG